MPVPSTSPDRPRLGLVLSTVTEAPVAGLLAIGQQAEACGYEAVLVNEGRGDALAISQAIAGVTSRITVGTNIANLYFRHPFLLAATARTIAELAGGRLLLGLGMSHRGLLAQLGIDMGDARARLRATALAVRQALAGQLGEGFLAPPPALHRIPLHVAGNTVESAALAGEVGDGLMPFLTPRSHLPVLLEAARDARASSPLAGQPFECCLSFPTFVSEDEAAAQAAARYNLAFFARLPNYRRQWRRAGFGTAMDAVQRAWASGDRRAVAAQIPTELVEEVCVFGTPVQCRTRIEAFRAAGADLPVLAVSPVNEDRLVATRKAVLALAPGAA